MSARDGSVDVEALCTGRGTPGAIAVLLGNQVLDAVLDGGFKAFGIEFRKLR